MRVVETNSLDVNDLRSLFADEVLAVRVANFYPRDILDALARRICDDRTVGTYANAPNIARIGTAYFEKQTSDAVAESYETNAVAWINAMRQAAFPIILPNDKLRLDLDEIWPGGATLATLDGHRAFCGLIRIFRTGSRAEPHMDVLEWDRPAGRCCETLAAQLSANIYIRMPKTGGELVIWPRTLTRTEYLDVRRVGSYEVTDAALQGDPITILPRDGELILFNTRYIHAVNVSDDGDRITSSCFVGLHSADAPLSIWS